MTEIIRHHIYTSSCKRTSGSIEDYDLILRRPIILQNPHHYFKVIVKEATIPYTFQQVNTNFNQFSYILARGGVTYPQRTFSITNGNYNINSLIAEVKTQLIADIQTYLPAYNPTLLWTYDRDTMFVTFSLTPDATTTTYTIKPLTDQVSTMLGVVTDTTFGNVGAVVTTGSSTQPVNVSPITSIYIRSGSLKQPNLSTENLVDSDDISDILCQIPILNQPTSWIQYLNDLTIENKVMNASINDLNLYLTDNRSYSLNLRGIDWSCLLTVIEIEPPLEASFHQARADIRQGLTSVNEIIANEQLRKGAPTVKEVSKDKVSVPDLTPPPIQMNGGGSD
jgi:hypothetical protein